MNKSNWYKNIFVNSNGRESKIHLNIADGSFLMNGNRCSSLPKTITNCNIYDRWFNKTVIDVKPNDEGGYISNSPLKGYYYLFQGRQIHGTTNPTIIKRRDCMEYVMIPREVLKSDFPHKLIEDYSHWLKVKGRGRGNMFFCIKLFKEIIHQEYYLESNASFFLDYSNTYVYNSKFNVDKIAQHIVETAFSTKTYSLHL